MKPRPGMTITTMKGVGTPRRQAIGETGTHTPQVATAMPRRYCPHFRIIVTAFHRHQPGPYIEAERTPIVFDLSRQRLRTTARKIIALCAGLVIACIGPPGCSCASQFSTTAEAQPRRATGSPGAAKATLHTVTGSARIYGAGTHLSFCATHPCTRHSAGWAAGRLHADGR